ncbi:hypothetical protein LguiB_029338 [Lonicera macranthoides]
MLASLKKAGDEFFEHVLELDLALELYAVVFVPLSFVISKNTLAICLGGHIGNCILGMRLPDRLKEETEDFRTICLGPVQENVFTVIGAQRNIAHGLQWAFEKVLMAARRLVKIVKCFVDRISVDISFNQMAGRCALCFLEQVNQLIGRDHLFKRSILLIKAWCYYESRTLGAHHGLISTYALDVMILYIINMFHSTMETPLAVLYKFLDYYRTFEWERYCVTIYGRVAIPSLPNVVAEKEESSECGLLLTKEFLENCVQYFSIPTTATANREQFPVKFMNIMDPLKSRNNLGRSVNRANFYRIKSALNLGAHTLKQIFMGPAESMAAELRKFFGCTLDQNLEGERPNEQFNFPVFGDVGRRAISTLGRNYGNIHDSYYSQDNRLYSLPVPPQPRPYVSHPFARNRTPCLQYRWTDLSQTMMNEFIPREIGHRNALQLLSSSFGVQQFLSGRLIPNQWNIMALRASGAYIPNMGTGSSNLRGTGTFIPMVREQGVPRGTSTGMPDMGALNLEGTRNYSTHMAADERLKRQGTSTSICETAMERTGNWQGPGTSIANTNYVDADSWDYKKKRVVEWVEVDLKEAQNEYESCFDLSKEEFSFLSSSNRALASESGPSGADNEGCSHSVQPTTETEKGGRPEGHQSVQPPMADSEEKAGSSGSFFIVSLVEFPILPSRKKAVAPPTSEPVWPAATAQPSEVAQLLASPPWALRHSLPPPPSSPARWQPRSRTLGVSTLEDPILGILTDAAPGPPLEPSDCDEEV